MRGRHQARSLGSHPQHPSVLGVVLHLLPSPLPCMPHSRPWPAPWPMHPTTTAHFLSYDDKNYIVPHNATLVQEITNVVLLPTSYTCARCSTPRLPRGRSPHWVNWRTLCAQHMGGRFCTLFLGKISSYTNKWFSMLL